MVSGNAKVLDSATVFGNAKICGNTRICGNAMICGTATVLDSATVFGNAKIFGNARVFGNAKVSKDAYIDGTTNYITIGPMGSRDGYTTFYKTKDNGIDVNCGCFNGTIEKFKDAVEKTHKDNDIHRNTYLAYIECVNNTLNFKREK